MFLRVSFKYQNIKNIVRGLEVVTGSFPRAFVWQIDRKLLGKKIEKLPNPYFFFFDVSGVNFRNVWPLDAGIGFV